jgi:hypothetical protein
MRPNFFELWMISKTGDYKRIKFNNDVELGLHSTQLSLMYSSLYNQIILSLLTKKYFTSIHVKLSCGKKECKRLELSDFSF